MVSSDGKKYSQFGELVYMDDVSTEQVGFISWFHFCRVFTLGTARVSMS